MAFIERPPVTLYLVRHGQSMGNIDQSLYRTQADHAIELTALGQQQADEAGQFLRQELQGQQATVLRSPYKRVRQTEEAIYQNISAQVTERVEMVEMVEQQLGVFHGVPNEERAQYFPHEYERYQLQNSFAGQFWARPPQGESPYDVYNRSGIIAGHIEKAYARNGTGRFVLVAHGYWIHCFIMNWCNLPYEYFRRDGYINNAEIFKLTGSEQNGVIFSPALPTAEKPHAPTADNADKNNGEAA